MDTLKVSVPAFCFTLQNNLQFVAASHLGVCHTWLQPPRASRPQEVLLCYSHVWPLPWTGGAAAAPLPDQDPQHGRAGCGHPRQGAPPQPMGRAHHPRRRMPHSPRTPGRPQIPGEPKKARGGPQSPGEQTPGKSATHTLSRRLGQGVVMAQGGDDSHQKGGALAKGNVTVGVMAALGMPHRAQTPAEQTQAGLLLTRAVPWTARREHLLGLRLRLPREDPQGGQDLHLGNPNPEPRTPNP